MTKTKPNSLKNAFPNWYAKVAGRTVARADAQRRPL